MKPFDGADINPFALSEQEIIKRRVSLNNKAKAKTFLKIRDAAKVLGYSDETVRGLIANGLLACRKRKTDCSIRVSHSAIVEYLGKYVWAV